MAIHTRIRTRTTGLRTVTTDTDIVDTIAVVNAGNSGAAVNAASSGEAGVASAEAVAGAAVGIAGKALPAAK
jgi:hypothetical protein